MLLISIALFIAIGYCSIISCSCVRSFSTMSLSSPPSNPSPYTYYPSTIFIYQPYSHTTISTYLSLAICSSLQSVFPSPTDTLFTSTSPFLSTPFYSPIITVFLFTTNCNSSSMTTTVCLMILSIMIIAVISSLFVIATFNIMNWSVFAIIIADLLSKVVLSMQQSM